jgi:hypothetical protein
MKNRPSFVQQKKIFFVVVVVGGKAKNATIIFWLSFQPKKTPEIIFFNISIIS